MNVFSRLFGNNQPSSKLDPDSDPRNSETSTLGITFIREYIEKGGTQYGVNHPLSANQAWSEIKALNADARAEICYLATCEKYSAQLRKTGFIGSENINSWDVQEAQMKLASTLMRSKLSFTDQHLAEMLVCCAKRRSMEWQNPIRSVLSTAKQHLGFSSPPPPIEKALKTVRSKIKLHNSFSNTAQLRALASTVESLLNPSERGENFVFAKGLWGRKVQKELDSMSSADRDAWLDLFLYAQSATSSKPSKKWLSAGHDQIKKIGASQFSDKLISWIADVKPDPVKPDPSLDIAKGLLWLASTVPSEKLAACLGNFAQTCFVKIPNYGARSKKLGNAASIGLMLMEREDRAVAEILRLREKVKYPSVRSDLDKKISIVAERRNMTTEALMDSALPDFGLGQDGTLRQDIGDYQAQIHINDGKAILTWISKQGKPLKSAPKAMRENAPDKIKQLKQTAKDLTAAFSTQRSLLESGYLGQREWMFDDWKNLYLVHPVRRNMARNLVWTAQNNGKKTEFMHIGEDCISLTGGKVSVSKDTQIQLWHPLMSDTQTVLSWRKFICDHELTQPFKQAHREIYVLTDAEQNTRIYSNRFAAHILRQHQFKALCEARGWHYTLQGNWDSHNVPTKPITASRMTAEYAVDIISEDETSEAWIPLYLSSDQVRFFGEDGQQMDLEQVPPIIFSEIMRDIDLFVAVTSVANDPNWTDGGPTGRWGNYWEKHAFGELGETAKTRKALIADIIPKLAIADKLSISERNLVVKGKLNTYHIHFGSGNIMVLPENRYLCIVRAPGNRKANKIYLPFAGDSLLSLILSKAFMLADDDKIKDPSIKSQLARLT